MIVLALLAAGCDKSGTQAANAKPQSESSKGSGVKLQSAQKAFLTIEAVGVAKTGEVVALPGRVTFRPQAQSAVGATVAGRVTALFVRAGEAVKAGAPLLVIDSADAAAARATVDQAATRLAAAENLYRRNNEMVERGVGLEFERQEAESRLREARAEHERARQAVALVGGGQGSRVTVRAPSNGVVVTIRVSIGATVAPGGEPLLELGDPSRMQVVAQVPESDLRHVAVGNQAEVELPALNARVAARVDSVSPRVDPESRRTPIYLELGKRVEGLRAGMMAQVSMSAGTDETITVPVTAVLIKDGKRRVVYVERVDGTFEVREVQAGRSRDDRVLILKGLAPGERVVVKGALLLDAQAEQLL